MRLVFAGTPEPALPALQSLIDSPRHEVIAVLTRPDAASGRHGKPKPSPVARLALDSGIPVLRPERPNSAEFVAELTELRPDCCPVVAFGALLRDDLLAVPAQGWVNLHFSLLPVWRGAAPVQHAILRGDEVTGASTFLIESGLDTGPVYGVVTETIRPDDTAGTLLDRLAISGADLMVATMDGVADGTLVAVPQAADGMSLAPKITVEDARVDWTAPGRHIDRTIRACTPAPGAWTTFRGERLKLGPVRLCGANALAPGELRVERSAVSVGTSTIEVELGEVQPPGKRPMPAPDWARGARIESGERLG